LDNEPSKDAAALNWLWRTLWKRCQKVVKKSGYLWKSPVYNRSNFSPLPMYTVSHLYKQSFHKNFHRAKEESNCKGSCFPQKGKKPTTTAGFSL